MGPCLIYSSAALAQAQRCASLISSTLDLRTTKIVSQSKLAERVSFQNCANTGSHRADFPTPITGYVKSQHASACAKDERRTSEECLPEMSEGSSQAPARERRKRDKNRPRGFVSRTLGERIGRFRGVSRAEIPFKSVCHTFEVLRQCKRVGHKSVVPSHFRYFLQKF